MKNGARLAAFVVVSTMLMAACTSAPPSVGASGGADGANVAEGDAAPAFTLPTAEGGRASLSDYRGQAVLLYFSMGPG